MTTNLIVAAMEFNMAAMAAAAVSVATAGMSGHASTKLLEEFMPQEL